MANPEHLEILYQGPEKWNKWREENTEIIPDLSSADLRKVNLCDANFAGTDFTKANLSGVSLLMEILNDANFTAANFSNAILSGAQLNRAILSEANLSEAILIGTDLNGAVLSEANLSGANLSKANLREANLKRAKLYKTDLSKSNLSSANISGAILSESNLCEASLIGANISGSLLNEANLSSADLSEANLLAANLVGANLCKANLSKANLSATICVQTNFSEAKITNCKIHGMAAWNLNLENTTQKDLVITDDGEPVVTVDDVLVGQFIYLLLNNKNIRNVINSISSKAVLILGRFADPQRKAVLDGLRDKLRNFDLLPIVFDFDRPTDRDFTETIQTLAGMCMFVIADITNPKSVPLELEAIVKQFKIPYVPIIDVSVDPRPFAMLVDSQNSYHWVLKTRTYKSKEQLLDDNKLKKNIIDPVNRKREELRLSKNAEPEIVSFDD